MPQDLIGDPGRLRQVLTNLIGNAVKFTYQGEVVIRANLVDNGSNSPPGTCTLQFSVSDTGIGIPASKLERIFDPFEQADGSTTRRFGGTGLGLTICARLVGLMGGRIWVESDPDRGSTFHFTARFEAAPPSQRPSALLKPLGLRGVPVMIVDDNATNRQILTETVGLWGMRPVAVDSGSSAITELERAADADRFFPLILLDAQMPDMDGFEVAAQIQRKPRLGSPALVMLTSSDRQGDWARCHEVGMTSYLIKPVRQAELLNVILTALATAQPVALRTEDREIKPVRGKSDPLLKRFGRLRFLVAEDHVVNQRLVVRLLEKRGHEVTVVADGHDAIAAIKQQPFDLVLMDVQMPGMGGFEATAVIRDFERDIGRRTPIIAMTAHALAGDRERCLHAGMDGYVAKPIRIDELISEIDSILTEETNRNSSVQLRGRSEDPSDVTEATEVEAAP